MIKNSSYRRILIASLSLLLAFFIINIFPKEKNKIKSETIYENPDTSSIFLIDKNNYVAKTNIIVNNKNDKIELAKELVNALINGTNKNKYLPDGFISFVPEKTVLEDIKLSDNIIELYFNKEFINISIGNEEKMIESIVFTLTDIQDIKGVKIYVENNPLDYLPNTKVHLDPVLTRKMGINKKSKFNNYKNTKDITAYFLSSSLGEKYYIPITFTTDSNEEKIEILIKELKSSENIDKNLKTYLSANVALKNYEILENEVNVEFNNYIFNQFHKIDEEVAYALSMSIKDTYNVNRVNIISN